MSFRFNAYLLALLVTLSSISNANNTDKTIYVVADHWQNYTHHDGTGVYFEILRHIYEPHGYTIKSSIMPFKRAVSKINQNTADILLAEENMQHLIDSELYSAQHLLSPKQPIDKSNVSAIFTQQSPHTWLDIKNNSAAKLAWIRGYEYNNSLQLNHTRIDRLNNTPQGLNLLLSGRIDCFLDDIEDVVTAKQLPAYQHQQFKYEIVSQRMLYPVFYNSKRGAKLIKIYDQGMQQLIDSGMLNTIYNKAKLRYPFENKDGNVEPYTLPKNIGINKVK